MVVFVKEFGIEYAFPLNRFYYLELELSFQVRLIKTRNETAGSIILEPGTDELLIANLVEIGSGSFVHIEARHYLYWQFVLTKIELKFVSVQLY